MGHLSSTKLKDPRSQSSYWKHLVHLADSSEYQAKSDLNDSTSLGFSYSGKYERQLIAFWQPTLRDDWLYK